MSKATTAASDENRSETIDGATGKPVDGLAPPRRIDLSSLRDVRLEMAALYRRMDAGEIASGEANRRVWHLRQVGDIIMAVELESRICALEARQGHPVLSAAIDATAITTRRGQ